MLDIDRYRIPENTIDVGMNVLLESAGCEPGAATGTERCLSRSNEYQSRCPL